MREYLSKRNDGSKNHLKQINEALYIIEALGIPFDGLTGRRLEKMAVAFLAVAGLLPTDPWRNVKSNDDGHRLTSREIIAYVNKNYGENISMGSYDDIRRKDLKLLTVSEIITNSSANPNAATNSPTRRYALNPLYVDIIREYVSGNDWDKKIKIFMQGKDNLAEKLKALRNIEKIAVNVGHKEILFSPGEHNLIQKAIIEDFLPRYGYGAEVLYVGDTADKYLYLNKEKLLNLKFFELSHGELPDVVAYSKDKNWLYLIEAVHSANPITPLRHHQLEKLAKDCTAGIIYVTAFLDRKSSTKFIGEIAWETEVWIAENPDHLIHFNGDRFLGPHS